MSFREPFSTFDISGSGLAAQRLRMALIAQNVANANTMRGPDGEPYQHQEAVFAEVIEDELGRIDASKGRLGGVRLDHIATSPVKFKAVFNPGHPLADEKGFVKVPNIDSVIEMANMVSASRSYEANLSVLKTYRQMVERALTILK